MGDTGGASNSSNVGGDNSSGTSGAFTGGGGATGAGGTVVSCIGACDAVACGPGSYSYTFPGACCPTCVQCNVPCPACPPGTRPQAVPNQCCGMCVVDQQPSCDSGRMSYEAFRSQLLVKYGAPGCTIDNDCVLASEINRCVARCGVALPVVTSGDWKSNTISYADANCSSCPVSDPIPCAPLPARCVVGRCSLGYSSDNSALTSRETRYLQKYTERLPSTVLGGAAVECVVSDAGC